MNQPTPSVTRSDVERIVRRDFPSEDFATVMALLDEYGTRSHETEKDRVQLAVLKNAAGSIDELLIQIQTAKRDYRDVVSWAEYPSYSWDEKDEAKRQKTYREDWQQYSDWLNKGSNHQPTQV
ncbi:MAG TPA: hypothetical protein VFE51_10775 [Verrucomicrobiae bacterium]|nr:hypothetical protein [Verrucomicrobiae bacterium]